MSTATRALSRLIKSHYWTGSFTVSEIPGGASSRRFYLLNFAEISSYPTNPVLLITIPPRETETLNDFMNIFYYLRRMGVSVPRLYEMIAEHAWIVCEYIHSPTVETYLKENPEKVFSVYRELCISLAELQAKCRAEDHCHAFQRRFDAQKYRFEFEFHVKEQLLESFFQAFPAPGVLEDFSTEIIATLDELSEPLFVHRDYQSSNIFINADDPENRFSLIDYQDARYGSPFYDLVSLLWDSYVRLSPSQRTELIGFFLEEASGWGKRWSEEETKKYLDFTVIQRKLHDAGAFAYNYHRFQSDTYLPYITPAIEDALSVMHRYPQFEKMGQFLESILKQG